jgi:hypothetical protein
MRYGRTRTATPNPTYPTNIAVHVHAYVSMYSVYRACHSEGTCFHAVAGADWGANSTYWDTLVSSSHTTIKTNIVLHSSDEQDKHLYHYASDPSPFDLGYNCNKHLSALRPQVRPHKLPQRTGRSTSREGKLDLWSFGLPTQSFFSLTLRTWRETNLRAAVVHSLYSSLFPLPRQALQSSEVITMSSALKRLSSLAAHFSPSSSSPTVPSAPESYDHRHNIHQLSPTVFLPRAAAIEPDACAIYHVTANKKILRRSYQETADRARGLAYFLLKHQYKRVGILAPNTPAFLESIYGIGAAGAVNVAINYRLKEDDITYIFDHAEVDSIIVDAEFQHLLQGFQKSHPNVTLIVDTDTDATEGELSGPFNQAVLEGLAFDSQTGGHGWDTLETEAVNEEYMMALSYTSGTTARPKGVVYTHRGAYLASLGNIVESALNTHNSTADRCHYLWTLPMFHAMGWTFPWAVTAVRGTHYCLRKIDYPEIWRLLKEEAISHFNAAPTVNILLCADPNAEKLPGKCACLTRISTLR